MPRANDQIGPYTLISQLGRGAFGTVWLAERRGAFATTKVALKLTLDEDPDLSAIAQESQVWAQLGGHPNVLPIIEADMYDSQVVIVSEYAPDGSLEGWLKKHGGAAPTIESAVAMISGILSGLEHLHSKQIIHRDLKPANILLLGETPRLADFGLARVLKSSNKTAGIAGTPSYMSPEAFDGMRSEQSDIWSAGVIFYQLLSGRLPFPQTDLTALLGAIVQREPAPMPAFVPANIVSIIARALNKAPEMRFRSAAEMRNTLQSTAAGITGPIVIDANAPTQAITKTVNTLPQIDSGGGGRPTRDEVSATTAAQQVGSSTPPAVAVKSTVAIAGNTDIQGPETIQQTVVQPPREQPPAPLASTRNVLIATFGAVFICTVLAGTFLANKQLSRRGRSNVNMPAAATSPKSPTPATEENRPEVVIVEMDEKGHPENAGKHSSEADKGKRADTKITIELPKPPLPPKPGEKPGEFKPPDMEKLGPEIAEAIRRDVDKSFDKDFDKNFGKNYGEMGTILGLYGSVIGEIGRLRPRVQNELPDENPKKASYLEQLDAAQKQLRDYMKERRTDEEAKRTVGRIAGNLRLLEMALDRQINLKRMQRFRDRNR